VLVVVAVGAVVAALAGDATLLRSNVVFRVVVGLVVAAGLYVVVVALWLAYHRKTFRSVGAAGATAEIPDPSEVKVRDEEIAEFMRATTEGLADVDRRLRELEGHR
jgi:hypothetical protein